MTYLMPRLDETGRSLARRSSPNYRTFVTEFVIGVVRTFRFAFPVSLEGSDDG